MSNSDQAYYAVKVGRKPGIYRDRDIAQRMIRGYPKGEFRRCEKFEDAVAYLCAHSASPGSDSGDDVPDAGSDAFNFALMHHFLSTMRFDRAERARAGAAFLNKAIAVFCEGVCISDGTRPLRAGFAIWFEDPELHMHNECGNLDNRTANADEAAIKAVLRAMTVAPQSNVPLCLYTSNEHCVKVFKECIEAMNRPESSSSSSSKNNCGGGGGVKDKDKDDSARVLHAQIQRAVQSRKVVPQVERILSGFLPRGAELAQWHAMQAACP